MAKVMLKVPIPKVLLEALSIPGDTVLRTFQLEVAF